MKHFNISEHKLSEWFNSSCPISEAPNNSGIYLVFNIRTGKCCYVGQTTRPVATRLSGHIASRETSYLGQALYKNQKDYSVIVLARDDLEDKWDERYLIKSIKPEFNRGYLSPSEYTGIAKRDHEYHQKVIQEQEKEYKEQQRIFWSIMREVDLIISFYIRNKYATPIARNTNNINEVQLAKTEAIMSIANNIEVIREDLLKYLNSGEKLHFTDLIDFGSS